VKLLTLLFPLFLWANAQYPLLFSSFTDPIYKEHEGYKELLKIEYFDTSSPELKQAVIELERLKEEGFALDINPTTALKNSYAKSMRREAKNLQKYNAIIKKELEKLLLNREYKILLSLQESSLAFVKNSKEVAFAKIVYDTPSQNNREIQDEVSLEVSLLVLKDKLFQARDNNSSLASCLNDITSVNYFMIETEKALSLNQPCEALKQIENLREYDTASRTSCKEDSAYYERWHAKSEKYLTTINAELRTLCTSR
jgi:hypothetical protein